MSHTERGVQARDYFIEVEKRYQAGAQESSRLSNEDILRALTYEHVALEGRVVAVRHIDGTEEVDEGWLALYVN